MVVLLAWPRARAACSQRCLASLVVASRGWMASEEPKSWGEAIQQYAKAKAQRPRPDEEYAKPYRVTRYEKSREEVEYHPILQTFRDRSRETAAVDHEFSSRVKNLNIAKDKQIAKENPFDILTFADKRTPLPRPPPPAAEGMIAPFNPHAERPTFRHPLDSCYQYNIVSNLPLSQHHYTAPELRPNVPDDINTSKPRLQHMAALPRDFNILSNRYVEKHDDKVKLEREIQRRTAAAKYWETHDYEPILGQYLEPDKEAAYQEFIGHELSKQGMKSFNRLPPSLQRGEGFVYDITTHQVKNEELYTKDQEVQAAKLARNAQHWARQDSMRNAGLETQMLADTRAVNRQSHTRYVDTFRHGYNIIDHRDFRDPQTYMPPPRTRPEPTVWQAVGPDRPPPPPPPPPPPAIAPLLATVPPEFVASAKLGASYRTELGHSLAASEFPPALANSAPALTSAAAPVSAPGKGPGLKMLAEYESRSGAPA